MKDTWSSKTVSKPTPKPTPTPKPKSTLDIPLQDFCPVVRKMLIAGMVRGGSTQVIKKKKDKDDKSKEKKLNNKLVHSLDL